MLMIMIIVLLIVIIRILYWLLSNLEALRKRSYLAKFCMNMDVPEDGLDQLSFRQGQIGP